MCHELDVVYEFLGVFGWIFFELLQLVFEQLEVLFKFRLVLVWLSLYPVLQLCKWEFFFFSLGDQRF